MSKINPKNNKNVKKNNLKQISNKKPIITNIKNKKQMKQLSVVDSDKKVVKRTRKEKKVVAIPSLKEAKNTIDVLTNNPIAVDYLKRNVSKNVFDIIDMLSVPRTDEFISEKLGVQINNIRRTLNRLQNYGITNYYVAKNINGWLSFAWYINTNKILSFFNYIESMSNKEVIIKDDCNDYFICKKCYTEDKLIFTFEAAYEAKFKCVVCNKNFDMITKDEAKNLVNIN